MATNATADDDIDTETLQSQIDLSMSLVHNLVLSWVKPSENITAMSNKAQKELVEYMRRPPRYAHIFLLLGVYYLVCSTQPWGWCAYPETSTTLRDTARLKSQLTGVKKRLRDEDGDAQTQPQSSDDDEESRAAMIAEEN